jgi:hypothetical protein
MTRVLLTTTLVVGGLLTSGCGAFDTRQCRIADGQEPLNGLTPEEKLEQLVSSEDSGWPDVPDGDWEREETGEVLVFTNGDARVSFIDDALVGVAQC